MHVNTLCDIRRTQAMHSLGSCIQLAMSSRFGTSAKTTF